jgi:protein SEY1
VNRARLQVPASALSLHLQQIWQIIVEQKDLDLPAHKVMVAHIRCKDIAKDQLAAITGDQAWQTLLRAAADGDELVPDFVERAAALVQSCLFGYDSDAMYFVESVRSDQKRALEGELHAQLKEGFTAQRTLLQKQLVADFRARLSAAADTKEHDVVGAARTERVELLEQYTGALVEPVVPLVQLQACVPVQ